MREIDEKAVLAAKNSEKLTEFINEYESFIIKSASKATGKYITKSSDEWSVSLSAFSQAVQNYSFEKGNFLSFADLVIKRRLIDFLRTESRRNVEILVNPHIFSDEYDEQQDDLKIKNQVMDRVSVSNDNSIKYEIEAINTEFSKYGFSFFDLTECSPKAEKTKNVCAKAAVYIIKNPILLEQLRFSKTLPIKTIEKNTHLPRKVLERHRKYIIAAIEIISGNYPYLAEYMRFIREEL